MADLILELGSYQPPIEFWIYFKGALFLCLGGFSLVCIIAFIVFGVAEFVKWIRSRGNKNV